MALLVQGVQECHRLNGFTQTHLVGQNGVDALAPAVAQPVNVLDASVPQETILRHKELLELKKDADMPLASNEVVSELDEIDAPIKQDKEDLPTKAATATPAPTGNILRQSKTINAARRQRLISTSLTKTPIVDGEFEDYHQHRLKPEVDEFDPKYRLYAVVVGVA